VEIRDLAQILRRFWLLVVGVFASALLLGCVAAYAPAQKYKATATLLVTPAAKTIDYSAVQAVQFLLPSLTAEVGTHSFVESTRRRILPRVPWNGASVSATNDPGTSIIRIDAVTLDPASAAVIANAAADTLIAKKVSPLVRISLIDPARPPGSAFSPNRKLVLFSAAIIGLIAAIFAALGMNSVRPQLSEATEIRRRFGLEVIGEIPRTRRFPRRASRLFDPFGHETTRLSESYHRLRSNFEIVAEGRPAVAITSATAGAGKSSVTANLAWSIASMGENVVAVDTDLRRPTLHEFFGVSARVGVADVGRGADIDRLTQKTELPQLRVLPAGNAVVQHPTSILHNGLGTILDTFDDALVLVDTPPLLGTAESILVATMTKSVVIVVDARRADPSSLAEMIHELERANAEVLGVVLNHARAERSRRNAYYYYGESRTRSWRESKDAIAGALPSVRAPDGLLVRPRRELRRILHAFQPTVEQDREQPSAGPAQQQQPKGPRQQVQWPEPKPLTSHDRDGEGGKGRSERRDRASGA